MHCDKCKAPLEKCICGLVALAEEQARNIRGAHRKMSRLYLEMDKRLGRAPGKSARMSCGGVPMFGYLPATCCMPALRILVCTQCGISEIDRRATESDTAQYLAAAHADPCDGSPNPIDLLIGEVKK